jgi:tetratricopeptide (TPR) repeat protein
MREAGIGRVLVASLHQGIADILPNRLTFYENWLNAEGLREGTIGLAPLYAVLSFLRQEGDAYNMITRRAGEYAAEWTVQSMSPVQRAFIKASPVWIRRRLLLRLARRLVRSSYQGSRVVSKLRRGTARIDVRASIFCTVREKVEHPLCGFYAAAFNRLLGLFGLETQAEVVACRGTGESSCVVQIALAVAVLVALLPSMSFAQGTTPTPGAGRILVMPFENVTRDGRIFWLGEASALLLADDLNVLGADAIAREERREAFERLQVPQTAALTDATVIRIGHIVGAAQVIKGTLQLDGDVLVVRVRAVALEAAKIQTELMEQGPIADIFATFERIARLLVPRSNVSDEELQRERPQIAAFENYIKGILADQPATAISYLNAALRVQSTFDRARFALWEIYTDQDAHERALAAVQPVRNSSAWSRRARFLTGLSQMSLNRNDEAYMTFKGLADQNASANVLNNLGVIQLRRGSTPETGEATFYFNRAVDADATDGDYFFNLGYAYWMGRETQATIYWLREAVRRNAADGDAHYVLGAALSAAGNGAEANREKELARRLSSTYEDWEKKAEVVPRGLERVKGDIELPHVVRVEEALATSSQRDQQQLAVFYLDRARRLYQRENDREALEDLNRVLYLSPYQADAHLLVGRIHLRGGRPREAIDAFKISLWSAETVDAHIALADAYMEVGDAEAARAEAGRAVALDPSSATAKQSVEKMLKLP